MILQNFFLTVIKTTSTDEGKVFCSMRYVGYLRVGARSEHHPLSMVLRCIILSDVLLLRSWACDFNDGQVIIVHGKLVCML